MIKTRAPKRAISAALAFVLTATLIPSAALPQAYADPAEGAAESQAIDATDAADAANADAADDAKSTITSADVTSEVKELEGSSAAAEQNAGQSNGQSAAANAAQTASSAADAAQERPVDMMRASVSLNNNDAAPVIVAQAGIMYQVDETQGTAAVTGVDPSTQAVQLDIPQTITSGGKEYKVTALIWGGGSRLSADFGSDEVTLQNTNAEAAQKVAQAANGAEGAENVATAANPYSYDAYTDASKAPAIARVFIPATVERIDPAFFQLFPNASHIEVAANSAHFSSYNGMLLNAAQTSLLLVPEGMEGNAVLPATMTTVPACVFSRCTKLTAIVATHSAGGAANSAFTTQDGILYTNDLKTLIAAPAGLGASARIAPECTHIAEGAFWGNTQLKTIVATGAVEDITMNPAFDPQAYLNSAAAEGGAEHAAETNADVAALAPVPAFDQKVVESATVTTPERAAWEAAGFKGFADPATPGDTAQADGFAFMLLPDYTLRVSWAGEGAPSEDLVIPATGRVNNVEYAVSAIAEGAFKGQPIRTLTLPEGISAIGAAAFQDCTNLAKASLAGSVATIGNAAFQGCTALTEVDLGGGLRTIGASAFEGTAVGSFWLPASVTSVGARAFAGNAALQRVAALGDIADVDATALADCNGVEIYTPYREDEAYAWRAGVPATGNHLLPYGVKLAEAPLTLHQDQTASLIEGGYLEAAGSMDVRYSYNAAPISVDPSSATVAAKQTGKTAVAVNLVLDGRTLASAARSVIVAKAAEPIEEETEEETAEGDATDDGHDRDGEEENSAVNIVDNPEVSYKDQLFEEGEYYTSGIYEATEKVINQTVTLSDMDADISTMSLSVPAVGNWNTKKGNDSKGVTAVFDSYTKTLTITMTGGYQLDRALVVTGSNAIDSAGNTDAFTKWQANENNRLGIRHLVLENYNSKRPKNEFSWLANLETITIKGTFNLGNGSSVDAASMFRCCYSLRVIPSEFKLPSTVTKGVESVSGNLTNMFSFDSRSGKVGYNLIERLSSSNQLVNGKLLTAYAGSDSNVIAALNNAANMNQDDYNYQTLRQRVTSHHTVTFDNQGGSGGHQTAGESTSASNKTYTIKVPHGSPIPELAGTPTYSSWIFDGYVDALNNAPKSYIGSSGYPYWSTSSKNWIGITSNMTLKAFWHYNADFYTNGGSFAGTYTNSATWHVNLPKGYSVAMPSGFSFTDLFNNWSNLWKVYYPTQLSVGGSSSTVAPEVTHLSRSFRGYGLGSNPNPASTKYYDVNRNPSSQIYNETKDFYAIWGEYNVTIYSNIKLSLRHVNFRWQNWATSAFGTATNPELGASYTKGFTVEDAYGLNLFTNTIMFTNGPSGSQWTEANEADWRKNGKDVSWTVPTDHKLKEVRWDNPTTGAIVAKHPNGGGDPYVHHTLSSNRSIYLIFEDNTPTDTFTFNVNGGKWSDGKTDDKTTTARRGDAITTPGTPTRTATAQYNYSFEGWSTDSAATSGSTDLGKANGDKTYYAIWKATTIKYTITWKLDGAGAYWDEKDKPTTDKTTSVAYGETPKAPATPKRSSTAEYDYTFNGWTPVIDTVKKATTYKTTWTETKRKYTITWQLTETGAYWDNNTKDTANKTTSVTYGDTPSQPATPKRSSTAEYDYTFAGWTPAIDIVTGAATYKTTWTEKRRSYAITWVANGGTWTDGAGNKSSTHEYGKKITGWNGSTVPTRTHYTFIGWATDKNGGASTTKEITVTGAKTYYAIWSTPYGFTIDPNGGEFKVGSLGLTGRDAQYLWTKNFRVKNNALNFSIVKADGTNSSYATVNGSNVERPGYSLYFWYWDGSHDSIRNPDEGIMPGATYRAYWTENDVTVKYEVGTAGGGSVTQSSETVKAQNGSLSGSQPKHNAGWHFVGWNTKADGTGTMLFTDETRAFVPGKQAVSGWDYSLNVAATYYAIFAPNDYTIELKKNDGTDDYGATVGTVSAKYDTPWTIRAGNVPNLRGYYFVGWDTDPNYKGMTPRFPMGPDASGKFQDKQFTENLTAAEDADGNWVPTTVTLYAIWNESRYTVLFHENWDDDPGTGTAPARIDLLYSQQVEIPTNDLARTGYNFANWNTAPDGSGTTYKTRGKYTQVGLTDFDDAHVRGAVVHLYAQWDANQYIVQFEPNIVISDPQDKGEWHIEAGDEVKLVQYGQDVVLDTVFSRPGYEFVGWSFDKSVPADDDDTPIVDFRVKDDGTFDPGTFRNLTSDKLGMVRLYAQWKGGGYTIEFDGNAADDRPVTGGPIDALDMHYGVAKKLPANVFTCDGFTFKGWNTKADGTGTTYLDQALVQDVPGVVGGKVTLYAQWAPILSLTSPIDACIEVYIDGMDMYVYEVRAGKNGWPTNTPNGDGTKDDHEDEFTHGQAALESKTPAKLFIEQIDCIPNLDPDEGMARIFPVDGEPAMDSWEDFELEFTARNEDTGKNVKASTEFGNSYAFVPGAKNNYYIPAADAATGQSGKLEYSLLLRIPDDEAKKPNTVRYAEGPVKIATLVFTCRVAD